MVGRGAWEQHARVGAAMDMQVVFHDLVEFPPGAAAFGGSGVDGAAAWSESDVISLHVDGAEKTRTRAHERCGAEPVQAGRGDCMQSRRGFVVDAALASRGF